MTKMKNNATEEYAGKEEISRRLCELMLNDYGIRINRENAHKLVQALIQVITEILSEGRGVNFRNIMRFGLKYIPEKTYIGAMTNGTPIVKPAHLTPFVKFCPSWRERVENELTENGLVPEEAAK